MTRVLCTFAKGDYQQLLGLTRPAMLEYAARHGYVFLDLSHCAMEALVRLLGWRTNVRLTLCWYKVPVLYRLLTTYGVSEVLWLDADALIVDGRQDLAAEVPAACVQGLVFYRRPAAAGREAARGPIAIEPGTGQWLVRPSMAEELSKIWKALPDFSDRPCHEQSALVRLLGGCADGRSMGPGPFTDLYARTHQLDHRWGAQRWEISESTEPAIRHAVGGSVAERAAVIKAWLDSMT
jgi:hypothetical protein